MSEFIANNYQVISVSFGLLAALFVLFRVSIMGLKSLVNYIEHEQRNKWQAEFFDINLGSIDSLRQEIKELERDIALLKENYAANNGKLISD
jgi:hypothetical protein